MRDPRPGFAGFAKRFLTRDPSSRAARSAAPILGTLVCCACGGAAASGGNGAPAAPAPAPAPPAAIAPEAPSEPRSHPLRYSAPEGCPGIDGYLGDVESRATTLELEPSSDAAEVDAASDVAEGVEVRVEPAPDARGWLGHVTIAGPRALDREVRGERCEDVVAALALITVLRLEGSDASERGAASGVASGAGAPGASAEGASARGAAAANTAPSAASRSSADSSAQRAPRSPSASTPSPAPGQQATAAAPSPSPAPAAPEASTPSAPTPAESAPAATPEDGEEASARAPVASTPVESSPSPGADDEGPVARGSRSSEPERPESIAREPADSETTPPSDTGAVAAAEQEAGASGSWPPTSFGVAALGGYATVPSHAFRAALEGELRLGEGTSAWLTSLSFAYARGDHSRAPSDLGLTLLTLELALCPPSFVAEPSLWISACASVRGGAVHLAYTATAADIAARDRWRPWLAVGPSLRVGVPLSERWMLRGVAQLAVQLVRDTYTVGVGPPEEPGAETVPLYRPEALSLEVGGGIGYSF
jgi:hypothetical protein